MNILGHNYVAKLVLGRYNSNIAAGCHLPDLVPFLQGSVLSFEEIHESPERVYAYSNENNGKGRDVALGLMTHSVKFGADTFNRDIDSWLIGDNDTLKTTIAEKIAQSSNISMDLARGPRMHNYLWCGVDFFILDNYANFASEMNNAYQGVNTVKIAELLSAVFGKPYDLILGNIDKHIGLVVRSDIKDKTSFLHFWKDFISELPDKDDVHLEKAMDTISFIEECFYEKWDDVIQKVVSDITDRMKPYLS